MNKLLIGGLAAVGTGAAGVGGALLISGSSGGGNENEVIGDPSPDNNVSVEKEASKPKETNRLAKLTFSNNVKDAYSEIDCLKNRFPGLNWDESNQISYAFVNGQEQTTTASNIDISSLSTGSLNGCLLVEYNKKTVNQKWEGNFKAVWTISNETQGLIFATTARTDSDNGAFKLDGIVYVLNKSNDTWNLINSAYRDERVVSNTEDLQKLLVKPGESIENLENLEDYWGFNPDPNGFCQASECDGAGAKETSLSATWEFQADNTGKEMYKWSENFNDWTSSLFPNFFDKSKLSINQKGKWINKAFTKQ